MIFSFYELVFTEDFSHILLIKADGTGKVIARNDDKSTSDYHCFEFEDGIFIWIEYTKVNGTITLTADESHSTLNYQMTPPSKNGDGIYDAWGGKYTA